MAQVLHTNIAKPTILNINGKEVETGIYKNPVEGGIFLGKWGVQGDTVSDRRVHGGEDKACYLYPFEHYDYWKEFYPDLKWQAGMFGENLTTTGLVELKALIGAEYQIGDAIVQVSQPRQPCYKLVYKFDSKDIVKHFRKAPFPGVYFRVIKEGHVKATDQIKLLSEPKDSVTVLDVYCLLMRQIENNDLLEKALTSEFIAESAKQDLQKLKDKTKTG